MEQGLVDPELPDDTHIDAVKLVASSLNGLAEITKSKQPTVQFIHESVRDFLVKEKGVQNLWPGLGFDWEGPSHEILKRCCTTYLHHPRVQAIIVAPEGGEDERIAIDVNNVIDNVTLSATRARRTEQKFGDMRTDNDSTAMQGIVGLAQPGVGWTHSPARECRRHMHRFSSGLLPGFDKCRQVGGSSPKANHADKCRLGDSQSSIAEQQAVTPDTSFSGVAKRRKGWTDR